MQVLPLRVWLKSRLPKKKTRPGTIMAEKSLLRKSGNGRICMVTEFVTNSEEWESALIEAECALLLTIN